MRRALPATFARGRFSPSPDNSQGLANGVADVLREPLDDGRTAETRLKPSLDPRLPLPGTPLIRRFQYEDGGYTGANMDRPALRRLLADIQSKKVDCVVVYKVDRLS
jgi:hypothetical protein